LPASPSLPETKALVFGATIHFVRYSKAVKSVFHYLPLLLSGRTILFIEFCEEYILKSRIAEVFISHFLFLMTPNYSLNNSLGSLKAN
jgi:hypothetical protein